MKILTDEQVAKMFRKHVRSNFDSNGEAGVHYGCTSQYVSQVICGARPPNEKIMRSLGIKKVKGYMTTSKRNSP
jgi:hypothetical protein